MKASIFRLFALASILVLAGCETTSQGSKTYTRGQAQSALTVFSGTVLAVAEVTIEGQESGVGGAVGGVAGGVAGSTVGSGRGRTLATLGGALAGAAAGSAVERSRATRQGVELEVELDDGRLILVVQELDDVFSVGDRVRVVEAPDGTVRIRQ